jgi:hypothetical protein
VDAVAVPVIVVAVVVVVAVLRAEVCQFAPLSRPGSAPPLLIDSKMDASVMCDY